MPPTTPLLRPEILPGSMRPIHRADVERSADTRHNAASVRMPTQPHVPTVVMGIAAHREECRLEEGAPVGPRAPPPAVEAGDRSFLQLEALPYRVTPFR